MTSVCPALWPPWKRTTTSARADSQSTILPLPSSPHWAPITATFDMGNILNCPHDSRGAAGDYSDLAWPLSGRFWSERNKHGDAAAIGIISLRAKLFPQETLFKACLDPEAERQECDAGHGPDSPSLQCRRNRAGNDARVDRMTHDRVGAGVDDMMIGLLCHRTRPQPAEIKPGPPGERHRQNDYPEKRPIEPGPKRPELARAAGRGRPDSEKQNATHEGHDTVEPLIATCGPHRGAVGPECRSDPRHEPRRPDHSRCDLR